MKAIFLDIDGVMNNPGCYAIRSGTQAPALPSAVEALNRITAETGAQIVISSTWRLSVRLPDLRGILRGWGVTGDVIACTTSTAYHRDESLSISRSRGEEIARWLEDGWREEIESYVILDDESDLRPVQQALVQTQGHVGLTMSDADRAIKLLGVRTQEAATGHHGIK